MMDHHKVLWVTLMVLLKVTVINGDFVSDEASLLQTLRNNYSVNNRPANTTIITLSFKLTALNHLDIDSEVMSVTGIVVAKWHDQRLTWNPTTHGIYKMVVSTKYIWVPPLVMENEMQKVEVLGTDGTPLRILSSGHVFWTPPVTPHTSCSADITYYPYDKQTCTLVITDWSYTTDEVDMTVDPDISLHLRNYIMPNGEWDLMGTSYAFVTVSDVAGTYRKVLFNLTFRRKWPYYGHIIMLPITMNSILITMVFRLPIESGEKMGYCLTVLLSYVVMLTTVSDSLPSISNQTSVVQVYLSLVMAAGTIGTLCTIGVLRLYHRDEKTPVPRWLQEVTRVFLAPLTCTSHKAVRVVSAEPQGDRDAHDKTTGGKHMYTSKEIAQMMDTFLFPCFSILMIIITVSVVIVLMGHYDD